ncbi:ComF family protein [bacterium]|nr:ComF family protein [bacterium]
MAYLLQSVFNGIKDIVYPNNCVICNNYVEESQNCICKRCFSRFEPTWLEDWIDKLRFPEGIDEVYSSWYAIDAVNDIIHNVKYHNQPRLGEELGRRMAAEIPIDELGEIDLLTAIPLNSVKNRERGYNQSEWICKGLAKAWNVPYQYNLLKRIKYTSTQTDLSATERKKNMENAFTSTNTIDSLSIAIVDDVITTGATLSACAVVLKNCGASKITGVSCCTPQFGY